MAMSNIKLQSISNLFYISIIIILGFLHFGTAVNYKVTCSPKLMVATFALPNKQATIYLDRLKGYPVCKPQVQDDQAVFQLSLEDFYSCGTTRVYDRITGRKLFYHNVVIELGKQKRETVLIKCDFEGDKLPMSDVGRPRRNVLPANFTEAVEIEKIATVVVEVPPPMVHVSVKQNELPVDTQVNVQPGTPLQMDISLDKNSTDTYGLFVKDIKVTDNSPNQEEVIMQNGCSVDPYLFTNFVTHDGGDNLSAKFRAFKFPDSSYVLFIGTVNVCLQTCEAVSCSNGQVGFGRRRRGLVTQYAPKDPNKIFEITMTTIVKVDYREKEAHRKDGAKSLKNFDYERFPQTGATFQSDNSIIINKPNDGISLSTSMCVLIISLLMSRIWNVMVTFPN